MDSATDDRRGLRLTRRESSENGHGDEHRSRRGRRGRSRYPLIQYMYFFGTGFALVKRKKDAQYYSMQVHEVVRFLYRHHPEVTRATVLYLGGNSPSISGLSAGNAIGMQW